MSTRSARSCAAEGRVLDEREIIVVEGGTAEAVAAQRSKEALVGSAAAGHVNRDGEESGRVACALPK